MRYRGLVFGWDGHAPTPQLWKYPYLQHDGAVNVAVYSPDGLYIASASADMTVRI